jgi:hypothetical protein
MTRRGLTWLVPALLAVPLVAAAQGRYALVVTGASGDPAYAEKHDQWRVALIEKLTRVFGFEPDHLLVLDEQPVAGDEPATRDGVQQAVARLQRVMRTDDLLVVVLIGHGTYDGADAKFNLVGPDLDAHEWAALLGRLPGRLVVVDTTGASFPFLAALGGPRRVVVTATDSPAQQFSTVFPEYFVGVLDDPASDIDKNGRVSMWEAFMAVSARVRQHYEQSGQLSTERPLLDDNGDGVGKEAGAPGPDGPLASQTYLDVQAVPDNADAELVELLQRRAMLEAQVEELKTRKPLLDESDYARAFEQLMIDLAKVGRAIRRKKT